MKIVGILGILLLLVGLLVLVIGVGGAVMNFGFPPDDLVCDMADRSRKEAEEALRQYEAAKGTPQEDILKFALDQKMESAKAAQDSCGRMKESYTTYGLIFLVVAIVGFFMVIAGAAGAFFGLRKKKAA